MKKKRIDIYRCVIGIMKRFNPGLYQQPCKRPFLHIHRKDKRVQRLATVFALLVVFPSLAFGLTYNESIDGDLPHPSWPSVPVFAAPDPNFIIGQVDGYSDAFILDIGPNVTLDSFLLNSSSGATSSSGASATFTLYHGPLSTDPALVSFMPWDTSFTGSNVLSTFEVGPLGPGQYLFGFWHNNSPMITYEFELQFSGGPAIPEPSTLVLHLTGMGLV